MVIKQQRNKEVIVNELQLMKSCSHGAIVNFIEAYAVDGVLWVRCLWVVKRS